MQESFWNAYPRRLPVYILLDCSGSMAGNTIIAVNEGLWMIYRELMADPQALETVHISVIRFADHADQYELTPIDRFQPPTLSAGGLTAMGAALRLLAQSIEQDLLMPTPTQHGDFRPLVFLLTDGAPTDSYKDAIQKLQSLRGSQKPTIVALGCGDAVNKTMLREVTNDVFLMHTTNPENIKGFFRWISNSIIQVSHQPVSRELSLDEEVFATVPLSRPEKEKDPISKSAESSYANAEESSEKLKPKSLFAVARAQLESGDRAFIGNKPYFVMAGISPYRLDEHYSAEPFDITMHSSDELVSFDILLHASTNIELQAWQKHIEYNPRSQSPQLVRFAFQVKAPGSSFLVVDFYHERRWLKTIRLEFEAIKQTQHSTSLSGG